jgi:hypothetical protein
MRALSIRQPYAELILRGIKTVEYRSRATAVVGERFWIYAAKKWAMGSGELRVPSGQSKSTKPVIADNISITPPPPWMVELANSLKLFPQELPTGVIVGSAVIERVSPPDEGSGGMFQWHLAGIERAATLRKPTGRPQPVWFRPFA